MNGTGAVRSPPKKSRQLSRNGASIKAWRFGSGIGSTTEVKMMHRFERRQQPLASSKVFLGRVIRYLGFSIAIIGISLGIGILGYHFTEHMSWLDALLNASMILGGMGPVDPLRTEGGKLFASFYALFAGVIFLVAVGVFDRAAIPSLPALLPYRFRGY